MNRDEALQIIYDHCQHCDETEKAFEILKENKGDLISRQAVLAIVMDSCLDLDEWDDTDQFCKEIEELPSAENKGEWINENEDECSIYICSECGMSNLWESPFCPSCGADMRGDKE